MNGEELLVPIYENKGDIQSYTNYCVIKLIRHYKNMGGSKWRKDKTSEKIFENQFDFMPWRLAMKAIWSAL